MDRDAVVIYALPRSRPGWELSEEKMPESAVHDEAVELLKAILAWWARGRDNVQIARNLAIRWDEDAPSVGVDPDVSVLSPAPPEGREVSCVRTWLPGRSPPLVAAEIVSENNPRKDYVIAPDKYAASGTRELWIFDPLMAGPRSHGGPFKLQVWERDESGRFLRAYAGDGPARSQMLAAYLVPIDGGRKLRVADDPGGERLWPTPEEAALARERAALERERVALARLAELEAAPRGEK